ncbi:MAG: orotidine-5'-phosphate decarboxylase [Promethearchaeota archaeon]|nr:MAG: orotidine-5'-phosphate decarboxylase [Candidatus Lokiarchaeota archaeon]
MNFIQDLLTSISEKKSVVCMGLDPRLEKENQIPEYLKDQYQNANKIILEFNKALIDNTYDLLAIIKPQIAFYEKYDALDALKETINYAHKKDLLVLLDSKRNDIGTTSKAYAEAQFDLYKADACTINAYFGKDCIKPFLEYKEKGKFILVKTSNPSSKDFQDLFSIQLDSISNQTTEITIEEISKSLILKRNYIHMANLVQNWGKNLEQYHDYHNLGVVVGATYPEEMKVIRKIVKNSILLIPGYGTQGATAKDIKFGFDQKGLGAIVNSSRGIMFAYTKNKKYPPEKFAEAARAEIVDMRDKINKFLLK